MDLGKLVPEYQIELDAVHCTAEDSIRRITNSDPDGSTGHQILGRVNLTGWTFRSQPFGQKQ